jgi:Alpha-kinase family
MIVCNLQGRYRYDRVSAKKCRFELTDPAICSRQRRFGPTDLGEKGIESFFANHKYNEFCNSDGNTWSSPRTCQHWFAPSSNTMFLASATNVHSTYNRVEFDAHLEPFYEDDDASDYY